MNAIPPFNTDFVDFSSLAPVGLYIFYKEGVQALPMGISPALYIPALMSCESTMIVA